MRLAFAAKASTSHAANLPRLQVLEPGPGARPSARLCLGQVTRPPATVLCANRPARWPSAFKWMTRSGCMGAQLNVTFCKRKAVLVRQRLW